MAQAPLIDGTGGPGLRDLDPADTAGVTRAQADARKATLAVRLASLQELLYASRLNAVLVILQGMDASGKDGAIRHVTRGLDPRGVEVAYFRRPTEADLAHDFLWRVHPHVPARGHLGLFNRSHYEDVVAARVRGAVPRNVWTARFDHINAFERLLHDEGTIVLKLFLHVSRAEQGRRLRRRERDPDRRYKIDLSDYDDRERWDAFHDAYEDVLRHCAAPHAPWRVVPADHKWFRDLVVMRALVDRLAPEEQAWRRHLRDVGARALRALEDHRDRPAAAGPAPG